MYSRMREIDRRVSRGATAKPAPPRRRKTDLPYNNAAGIDRDAKLFELPFQCKRVHIPRNSEDGFPEGLDPPDRFFELGRSPRSGDVARKDSTISIDPCRSLNAITRICSLLRYVFDAGRKIRIPIRAIPSPAEVPVRCNAGRKAESHSAPEPTPARGSRASSGDEYPVASQAVAVHPDEPFDVARDVDVWRPRAGRRGKRSDDEKENE